MTREEYIQSLRPLYAPVAVLQEKEDCKILRLRNTRTGKDLVLRSSPQCLEAYETLCSIRCLHLAEVYDVICLEDGQIVLEEYIDGITVAQVLETGKYRPRGVKKVIHGVCAALSVLHQQGLVHRDVKPDNVMIGTDGRVVLIDFDASRRISNAQKDTRVIGTVGYAAPEQLGLAPSDARTDIYATGVLMNVMLTGQHPTQRFARGRMGRIIRKCTHMNPNERFQSADKLSRAL